MLLFAPSCCTVVLLSAPLAEAVATAATSAARSSASMRASAAEKRASTACVDVSSSKIESARRLVWRVADQRIALLPAMHIDELPEVGARGWLGPPLTAPRPEVDGGEWRVASRADLCAEMPRGPHVGTEVCAEMPCGSHVGSEVPVGRPHDRSVFQRP